MQFEDFRFSRALTKHITANGYISPYPIQEKAIPLILEEKDILGIAKTGSGKTASFVLPIISSFKRNKHSRKNRDISVLVLVPTRELAIQVSDVFISFRDGSDTELKIKSVYGGVSINPQMKSLLGVDILVATPGRLLDLVESNALSLSKVKIFVLDEADKMLNYGFREELNKILTLLPKKKQSLLFSATLNENINGLSRLLLNNPVLIDIDNSSKEHSLIEQTGYLVSETKKGPLLRYLIKHYEMQRVLVFASSIYLVKKITAKLNKNGIKANAFHGKTSQTTRRNTLQNFKEGKTRVLVATDLLSRGIDIIDLPVVVNYDLPRSPKDYIHRIGRTGRAESTGEAISLITPDDIHHFKVIQKKMGTFVEIKDSNDINLNGY